MVVLFGIGNLTYVDSYNVKMKANVAYDNFMKEKNENIDIQ